MVDAAFDWQVASTTHAGKIRNINEDSLMVNDSIPLWAVADGMGGHEAGDLASKMVVDSLDSIAACEHLSDFVDHIEDALLQVNSEILDLSAIKYHGKTMGSTVVLMTVSGVVGICMWAGDSRLYRLREDQLAQISRDHSQVEEMIARGMISRDDADSHPSSNVITRAVGAGDELYIDVAAFNIQEGDTYLLCSDGLYNEVADEDIMTCLNMKYVGQSTTTLLNYALSNGARDNISIVVSRADPL